MTNKQLAITQLKVRALEIIRNMEDADAVLFSVAEQLIHKYYTIKDKDENTIFRAFWNVLAEWKCKHNGAKVCYSEKAIAFITDNLEMLNLAEKRDGEPKTFWQIVREMNKYAQSEIYSGTIHDCQERILDFVEDLKNTIMAEKIEDEEEKGIPEPEKDKNPETEPNKQKGATTELNPPVVAAQIHSCPRGRTTPLGCEFCQEGTCYGICYPTYPPQYDPCVFCK